MNQKFFSHSVSIVNTWNNIGFQFPLLQSLIRFTANCCDTAVFSLSVSNFRKQTFHKEIYSIRTCENNPLISLYVSYDGYLFLLNSRNNFYQRCNESNP